MREIALFSGKNLHSWHKFYTTAGRDKSQLWCWWPLSFITCISGNNHIYKSIIFSVKLSCYDIARPFSYQMLIDSQNHAYFNSSKDMWSILSDVIINLESKEKLRSIIFSYLHLLPDTQSLELSVSDLKDIVLKDKMKCEKNLY